MRLYYVTDKAVARKILEEGFRDAIGSYGIDRNWSGVWFSDVPLSVFEAADGDAILAVDLPFTETDLADYEWLEEGKAYREWLIPAELTNKKGTISIFSE
jgi:hypothetical protein